MILGLRRYRVKRAKREPLLAFVLTSLETPAPGIASCIWAESDVGDRGGNLPGHHLEGIMALPQLMIYAKKVGL